MIKSTKPINVKAAIGPILTAVYILITFLLILTALSSCEKQDKNQNAMIDAHKAEIETYISPSDQAYLDIRDGSHE